VESIAPIIVYHNAAFGKGISHVMNEPLTEHISGKSNQGHDEKDWQPFTTLITPGVVSIEGTMTLFAHSLIWVLSGPL
jgi:hypothetical protein